jgi:O-antigen/teichoic acid export membrane protein
MIRSLWRDGITYAVGTVLARGIGLLTLPLVVHTLTPAEYGALDLITTLGVLVNLVVPLEISQALARFWNERDDGEPRRRLAGTAWTFTLAGHAAFVALCSLAATPIAEALFGDAGYGPAVRAGSCAIAFNNIFCLLQNQFRWELRPRAYAMATFGYALANLGLLAICIWGFGARLEGVLWAQAIAAAGACAFCFAPLRRSFAFGIAREELAAMLRFSLPLVPAGIAIFTSFYINRLMLNALGTLQDVGIFGLASRLAGVVTLVLIGVQAVTPLVYAHHHEPETPVRLARLLEGFSAVALAACLALGLFGAELVLLLATSDYGDAAPLVTWLCVASILAQLYIFTPGIAIAKKTHWQLAITLCSAVTSVSLNALLIPTWGVWGATLATLSAGVVFFGAWSVMSQRLYPLPLRRGPMMAAAGLFVVLGLAVPMLDASLAPGVLRVLTKVSLLLVFVTAVGALGLLPLRGWRSALAAAG